MNLRRLLKSMHVCYDDWSSYIINPNFVQNGNEVTWGNRRSRRISSPVRLSDVHQMDAEGQYTYVVGTDRSIFRMYYRFTSDLQNVTGASLAYFSTAHEIKNYDFEIMEYGVVPTGEGEVSEINHDDESGYGPAVGWIRFDYDPGAESLDVTHSLCHVHLSGFPGARLIVSGIPSPQQFVEFVFCSFYPNIYRSHRLKRINAASGPALWQFSESNVLERINRDQLTFNGEQNYSQIVHFRVPEKT